MISQRFRLLSACLLLLTSSVAFGASKIVDGGAGTDSLTINYSGISSLGDFDISTSEDSTILTDSSSNTISFRLISNLTVGEYTYTHVQTDRGSNPATQQKPIGMLQKKLFMHMTEHRCLLIFGAQVLQTIPCLT